jgi:hypothetical protein
MRKKGYKTPCVLKTVTVCLERTLLESFVDQNAQVKTTGQEVTKYQFDQSPFTPQDWYQEVEP